MINKNDIRKEVLIKSKNLINIYFPNNKETMSKDFYNNNELIHIRRHSFKATDTLPYFEDYFIFYKSCINDRLIVCDFFLELYNGELDFCKSGIKPKIKTSSSNNYKKIFYNNIEYLKTTNKDLIYVEKF